MNKETRIKMNSLKSGDISPDDIGEFECLAWDLLGDVSRLIDTSHLVRLKNGKVLYEGAFLVNGKTRQKVRLARIATDPLRQINRTIEWDHLVVVVPIDN